MRYRDEKFYWTYQLLDTPLPHETGFNVADNPYTESEF